MHKARDIQRQIKAFNLMGKLMERLQVVVDGGVAETTVYKAYRVGPATPLLEKILETAEAIIAEHEAIVAYKIQQLAETPTA